jgi:hypothetical protein
MASVSLANGQVLISLLLGDKLNSGKIEFGLDGEINKTKATRHCRDGFFL